MTATVHPALFDQVAELVRRHAGLVFRGPRRSALESGVERARQRVGLHDMRDYLDRLEDDHQLLDDLVGELTIGETYFFRDAQQCALLRDRILPGLVADRPTDRPVRIWSAGCATGEEPCTVAIILRRLGLDSTARIIATDVSRAALAKARRGAYGAWSMRATPDDVIGTCFEQREGRFQLVAAIREAVDYRYLNLATDVYPSLSTGIWGTDLILCRNVLIYFDEETIARVARQLVVTLSDDGWLLLGASDPILSDLVECEPVVTDAGLAYRRADTIRSATRAVRRAAVPGLVVPDLPVPLRREQPTRQAPPPTLAPAHPSGPHAETGQTPAEEPGEAHRCYAAHDYDRAAELAERLVQRSPHAREAWAMLVRALANRGNLAAAGRACAAALELHRTDAELVYLHAVLLAEAGRPAEAAEAARRALFLEPGLAVAHLLHGQALARLGNREGARRAFDNAERLLAALPPAASAQAADGEPAGRLAEMARAYRDLLDGAAA